MIRPIEEKDIPACLSLYDDYVLNTVYSLEEKAVAFSEFAERVRRIQKDYLWLVEEENGEIVGYGYLDVFNPRSAYHISADLSLYVRKDKEREGIGKEILTALESWAREHGIRNLVSLITSENAPSLAFHQKMGFFEAGYLPNVAVKFGRSLGVYYYLKPLC
jgi:phosphinothricin acetyltransferase